MAEKQLRVDLEVSSDIAKTFLPPDNEALLNSTISFRGIKKSVAINDVLCEAAPTFQRQTMKMLIPIAHCGVLLNCAICGRGVSRKQATVRTGIKGLCIGSHYAHPRCCRPCCSQRRVHRVGPGGHRGTGGSNSRLCHVGDGALSPPLASLLGGQAFYASDMRA